MKRLLYVLTGLAVALSLFWTCEKPKSYPDIPEVEFKSLSIENTTDTLNNEIKRIKLTISVTDGDGDMGIKYDNGNIYPGFEDLDSLNLFIELYEKVGGLYQKVDLLIPHYYATPFLEPDGQDKTLKSDHEVSISYNTGFFTYDTLKYSFFIYDRARNKSNIAESPEIPADTLGLIEY